MSAKLKEDISLNDLINNLYDSVDEQYDNPTKEEFEAIKETARELLEEKLSENDDLWLLDAAALTLARGRVSSASLRRCLGVGYGRAERMLSRLRELELIGAPDSSFCHRALINLQGEAVGVKIEADEPEMTMESGAFESPRREGEAKLPEGFVPTRRPCAYDFVGEDRLLVSAAYMAADDGKLSASKLQRGLAVGFGRATVLLDRLEEIGVLAPSSGYGPRAALVTRAELENIVKEIKY